MPDEEIKVEKKPEVSKPKAKETETQEVWWSTRDPNHRIMIAGLASPKDGRVQATYVKFNQHRLELDLNRPDEAHVSKELHRHDRHGKDIFVLGTDYDEREFGREEQIRLDKRLREIAGQAEGIPKLRGLFSHEEIVKNGINPSSNDPDEFIWLAQKLKRTPKGV